MLKRSILNIVVNMQVDNPGTVQRYFGRSGFSLKASLQLVAR